MVTTNVLKQIVPGTDPLASDAGQFQMAFAGQADVGGLSLVAAQPTPVAPNVVASGGVGNLNGVYLWKVVVITGWQQSDGSYFVRGFAPSAESASVTVTNESASLTAIPTGAIGAIGRAIYRTPAGGASGSEKFVGIIWNNVTTTFTDNVADANLGAGMPTANSTPAAYGTAIPASVPNTNSTGTYIAESSALGKREMVPNYDQYLSNQDAYGNYTTLQLKRPDGTLYMVSTLSNPDSNGNYQTNTWQFYDSNGTTIVSTHVWSLLWDSNNKVTQKVMTS